MTIYFDTCALNRLRDDAQQPRVSAEAAAVEQILSLVNAGTVFWSSSAIVRLELLRNPDEDRREQTLPLLNFARTELIPSRADHQAAQLLQQAGFGEFDALHLAICEAANVDILLTVDDRLIRRAARLRPGKKPEVINPVDWIARRAK